MLRAIYELDLRQAHWALFEQEDRGDTLYRYIDFETFMDTSLSGHVVLRVSRAASSSGVRLEGDMSIISVYGTPLYRSGDYAARYKSIAIVYDYLSRVVGGFVDDQGSPTLECVPIEPRPYHYGAAYRHPMGWIEVAKPLLWPKGV